MPTAYALRLRQAWWAFVLANLLLDGLAPWLIRHLYMAGSAHAPVLLWLPFGLHMVFRLATVGVLWPSLKEGGRIQTLLLLQAALPLASLAFGRWVVPSCSRFLPWVPIGPTY